jgi:hypothetical protein
MLRTAAAALTLLFSAAALADDIPTIQIPASTPYLEGAGVPTNIKQECDLPARVSEEVRLSLQKAGYEVKTDGGKTGDKLDLHIAGAVSGGGAFTGHQKSLTVTGKLLRNGKAVGSFTDVRNSGGGAFGGYKGSCAVLNACAAAIGRDIAGFVKNPRDDAMLGDAR